MTYEELWDIAYSIGFHRGRMRAERNMDGIRADVEAFESLLARIPGYWRETAINRHNAGVEAGDRKPKTSHKVSPERAERLSERSEGPTAAWVQRHEDRWSPAFQRLVDDMREARHEDR